MSVCPAVSVPVELWSGQVECWRGLQVGASWRFVTATEPASEPKPAGESSGAAHSHCEPRPCLHVASVQGVKMSKGLLLFCPGQSLTNILYLCMYGVSHMRVHVAHLDHQWGLQPISDRTEQHEPQTQCYKWKPFQATSHYTIRFCNTTLLKSVVLASRTSL